MLAQQRLLALFKEAFNNKGKVDGKQISNVMKKYIEQLLADIAFASQNVSWPFVETQLELHDWISDDE